MTGNGYRVVVGSGASSSPPAVVRMAHNVITGNTIGVSENAGGIIMTMTSAGTTTNTIVGNNIDGTLSGTYNAK